MGWAVLYIAFGVVALWLLGEVLLQYKARLRWRLVAFFGFLLVVIGVLMPSVPVIALGTLAFATGQTFVTLSFRRGFSTGWALGGGPGSSRRRRELGPGEMQPMDPLPEPPMPAQLPPADTPVDGVRVIEAGPGDYEGGYASEGASALSGEPAEQPYQDAYPGSYGGDPAVGVGAGQGDPLGTGGAGGFGDEIYAAQGGQQAGSGYGDGYQDPYQQQGYGTTGDGVGYLQAEQPYATTYGGQDATETYSAYPGGAYQGAGSEGQGGQGSADPYADYAATQAFPATDGQPPGQADGYPTTYTTGYAADPSAGQWSDGQSYYQETPPGGVWVPQQREAGNPADAGYDYQAQQQQQQQQQQQPGGYPQQDGYDANGQPQQGYYYNNDQRY
ncbi:hypothetical protein [Streptomyces mayteni]